MENNLIRARGGDGQNGGVTKDLRFIWLREIEEIKRRFDEFMINTEKVKLINEQLLGMVSCHESLAAERLKELRACEASLEEANRIIHHAKKTRNRLVVLLTILSGYLAYDAGMKLTAPRSSAADPSAATSHDSAESFIPSPESNVSINRDWTTSNH